jgi:hypothetical protein
MVCAVSRTRRQETAGARGCVQQQRSAAQGRLFFRGRRAQQRGLSAPGGRAAGPTLGGTNTHVSALCRAVQRTEQQRRAHDAATKTHITSAPANSVSCGAPRRRAWLTRSWAPSCAASCHAATPKRARAPQRTRIRVVRRRRLRTALLCAGARARHDAPRSTARPLQQELRGGARATRARASRAAQASAFCARAMSQRQRRRETAAHHPLAPVRSPARLAAGFAMRTREAAARCGEAPPVQRVAAAQLSSLLICEGLRRIRRKRSEAALAGAPMPVCRRGVTSSWSALVCKPGACSLGRL